MLGCLVLLADHLGNEFLADGDFRDVVPVRVDLTAGFHREGEGTFGVDVPGEHFDDGRQQLVFGFDDVDLGVGGVAKEARPRIRNRRREGKCMDAYGMGRDSVEGSYMPSAYTDREGEGRVRNTVQSSR